MQGIYSITNKVNGKRYIGLSTNIKRRIASHKYQLKYNRHENFKLQRAWNKYGEESFKFDVLVECINSENLAQVEMDLIEKYDSFRNGYNCSKGGEGVIGYEVPEEARKKMSMAKQGTRLSQETRKKMSLSRKGKICSEETKRKIAAKAKGRGHSEEARKKMSLSKKGKKRLQESVNKTVIANKGKNSPLTESDVIDIRIRRLNGEKIVDINKDYDLVCKSTISKICNNNSWKNIPNTLQELLKLSKTA